MIAKGTLIHLTTTNGGEITATLIENYRPTYDAVIASGNGYAIIPPWRIKSLTRAAA